jgi:hypothetical protein
MKDTRRVKEFQRENPNTTDKDMSEMKNVVIVASVILPDVEPR